MPISLFEKCDIQLLSPEIMQKDFDCGDPFLNEFFHNDAIHYKEELLAKTYVLVLKDEVIAFFCVSNDKIAQSESGNSIWKKIKKEFPNKKYRSEYPAVKVGRLAVSNKHKNQNIGQDILAFIKYWFAHYKNKTGCRFITVDAYMKAVDFYESKAGFSKLITKESLKFKQNHKSTSVEDDTLPMFFDLKKFIDQKT